MSSSEPARTASGRVRSTVAVVLALAAAAAVGAVLGFQVVATSSSPTTSPTVAAYGDGPAPGSVSPPPRTGPALPRGATVDDGAVPDGVTVWDDEFPAVANLDPHLLRALRDAATAAAGDGVGFEVTSGWRSAAYQEQLLREAVSEYGSEEEAARWVATAETSLHVSGDAVDIGDSDATEWLSEHGAEHGLCQIYRNEPWHYELRPAAVDRGCPPPYRDPTEDPRMQR